MDFIGLTQTTKTPTRFRHFVPVLFEILLVVFAITYFSLPLLGDWLVRVDPVHKADAIAVLSGRFPQRALEAAKLYRRGYAPEVWLTHPEKGGKLQEYDEVELPSEVVRNVQVLRSFGVPEEAIRILPTPIVNTADELNAIGAGLKVSGSSSVIIVTNKAHTRRVYSLWEKYHSQDGEVLIHAIPHDQFAPYHWWRSSASRNQGIHELLGIIDVWAGMPVHRPLQIDASASTASVAPLP